MIWRHTTHPPQLASELCRGDVDRSEEPHEDEGKVTHLFQHRLTSGGYHQQEVALNFSLALYRNVCNHIFI